MTVAEWGERDSYLEATFLGSPKVKTAVNGMEAERWDHYPYGETWGAGQPGDRHRYTGHLRDAESENDYAGARYYANQRGRWLSVDPVPGDLSNPQRLNRYAYVGGDPVNLVDPDGREWENVICSWKHLALDPRLIPGSAGCWIYTRTRQEGDRGGGTGGGGAGGGGSALKSIRADIAFEKCRDRYKTTFVNPKGEVKNSAEWALTLTVLGFARRAATESGAALLDILAAWGTESSFSLVASANPMQIVDTSERSAVVDLWDWGKLPPDYQVDLYSNILAGAHYLKGISDRYLVAYDIPRDQLYAVYNAGIKGWKSQQAQSHLENFNRIRQAIASIVECIGEDTP